MSTGIVIAAARGIIMSYNRGMLEEFGGHVSLTRHWAHSILHHMDFVKRKATTAKSKHSIANFAELKQSFLADVRTIVSMEDIPLELIGTKQGSSWSHRPIGQWSNVVLSEWKSLASTINAKLRLCFAGL